jgi:hypothetical protein
MWVAASRERGQCHKPVQRPAQGSGVEVGVGGLEVQNPEDPSCLGGGGERKVYNCGSDRTRSGKLLDHSTGASTVYLSQPPPTCSQLFLYFFCPLIIGPLISFGSRWPFPFIMCQLACYFPGLGLMSPVSDGLRASQAQAKIP